MDKSRRDFFSAFVRAGLKFPERWTQKKMPPASPFGSSGFKHLDEHCISCGKCVDVCPTKVLQMGVVDYGLDGVMRPVLDFSRGYCDYECTSCMDVCPSGALESVGLDAKQSIRVGIARVDLKFCVNFAENQNPDSGAGTCKLCRERCPASAVRIICGRPVVEAELCIGCGACEFFCPASPVKGIRVEGYEEHK